MTDHEPYSREETKAEQLDRNFNEQLQESRIALAGVQILFAFLLTLPFEQRFTMLTGFQRNIYLGTLITTAVSVVLFTTPVAAHRMLFREGFKDFIVRYSSRLQSTGLFTLLMSVVGGTVLVLDVLLSHTAALWIGALLAALAAVLWVLVPFWKKSSDQPPRVDA